MLGYPSQMAMINGIGLKIPLVEEAEANTKFKTINKKIKPIVENQPQLPVCGNTH